MERAIEGQRRGDLPGMTALAIARPVFVNRQADRGTAKRAIA
jgi:hypothetical protein